MVETTATTDAELVERLRNRVSPSGRTVVFGPTDTSRNVARDILDGADRISALSAEVERLEDAAFTTHPENGSSISWQEMFEWERSRRHAAERQRDDLKAALERFERNTTAWADSRADERQVPGWMRPCIDAATAALSRLQEPR